MYTDRDIDPLVGEPAGKRFRAERKRLFLSSVTVAHACGTTESTVFNWEAGRARIPLHALERLWSLGFDPERLVGGPVKTVDVQDVHGGNHPVPAHLLARHSLSQASAVVFHNPLRAADLMPEGEVILLSRLIDFDEFGDGSAIVLFRLAQTREFFLASTSVPGKRSVRLVLGKTEVRIARSELMERCEPTGTYCRRLGNKPAGGGGADHEAALRSLLNGPESTETRKSGD